MADINISDLRDEVTDRLDNLVATGQLSEWLRQKLRATTRVTRSMNYAFDMFVREAPSDSVTGLIEIVSLSADTNVGTDGVQSGVKTWLWPTKAYFDREDGGILTLILDEREFPHRPEEMTPINTIRMAGRNDFYKDCSYLWNTDMRMARIYTGKGATAKARIVAEPFSMDDNDEYINGDLYPPNTIPVDVSYLPDIAGLTVGHLIETAGNISPPQEEEPEQDPEQ